jgi:diaminopimelate epimerase
MLHFRKMHGLGNDFVVLDGRYQTISLSPQQIQAIGNRHTGVGFDQLVILQQPPQPTEADVFMKIYNQDGSQAGACGNVSRCVAKLLFAEDPSKTQVVIQTVAGLLECSQAADGLFCVDMGEARRDWRDIPLAEPRDTMAVDFGLAELPPAVTVSMGNPHAIFFVPQLDLAQVARLGAQVEHHPLLPDRANVSFVRVIDRGHVEMRTWERGAGLTEACGSGACAAGVAAAARNLTDRRVQVAMPGGTLTIEWLPDNHVLMIGTATLVFEGQLDLNAL